MSSTRVDVAVVGGGHNGLVAAAYLAREGFSVSVLERDEVPGGAVSTVERFPGYQVDRGSSAHLMIRHTPILTELDLAAHGLRYIDCDPWAFAPAAGDSPAIVFSVDLDATCASIEASCGPGDADAYRRFVSDWSWRAAAMMRAFCGPPTLPKLTRAFWGLSPRRPQRGPAAGLALSQDFLRSGNTLLDSYFGDERLKAALAWFGAQSGPPMNEPGTAAMVGFAAAMHTIPPGRAVGGSGALTAALIEVITAHGGVVHLGTPVRAMVRDGSDWILDHSDTTRARAVVSACHILTALDLLIAGDPAATPAAQIRPEISTGNGIGMVLRVGARGLPAYPGLPSELPAHGVHGGLGLLVTHRGHLAAAHARAAAGELPAPPAVLAMGFSALDPTIAPPGRALLTLWSQWHPRLLSGNRPWSDVAEVARDQILAEFDRHAPGFTSCIEHVHIQTPADLESELGLVGGNIMHVDMSLDQMFWWRPHPELSTGTLKGAPGLFFAGASMHPGGGVNGASGRNAAAAVSAALRPRWRRRPG